MRATGVTARDFRNYERLETELAESLTVIVGPNGAGKTNLLEAVYFGCTGQSPRTSSDRDLVRRGAPAARVTVSTAAEDGAHILEAGLQPGEPKVLRVDGAPVENLWSSPARPLVSVFLPDRLALVKGGPSGRRAHLDQLVTALWPSRGAARAAYSSALGQRNALLARVRRGESGPSTLEAWDAQLAERGYELMLAREQTVTLLAPRFAVHASLLGLPNGARVEYRPRSAASSPEQLAAELRERHAADIERGFTVHGPHRDDLRFLHGEEPLRSFGSQGQQRVAILALFFAERELLAEERGRPPLMLLDDVMSELDSTRRELLADLLGQEGQAILTATDLDHVPGHEDASTLVVEVHQGALASALKGRPA